MRLLWLFLLFFMVWFSADYMRPPSSDGRDEHEKARQEMVVHQLSAPGRDIRNERVLLVMRTVPRHLFVPQEHQTKAYSDHPLPIGYGQTISQPFIVAYMTEQLDPKPGETILEIGTGSGYQAAVLSRLVKKVYTIEIVDPLAKIAGQNLKSLSYDNVEVKSGDGYQGWPEHAPFDSIIVTCAPEQIPKPLTEQLKEGGKMIIPVGPLNDQSLFLLVKKNNALEKKAILPVRFVPMTGAIKKEPPPLR